MLNAAVIRPLSRREYDHLVAGGLLDGERVELLEGFIVTMSPQGARHARVTARLTHLLRRALPVQDDQVRPHSPLAIADDSEPEPDVAVVPPDDDDGKDRHPASALLVVEVAQSSLSTDRHEKAKLYAAAGVPEYWIVNLVDEVVEVHTRPNAARAIYSEHAERRAGDAIELVSFPGVALAVDSVLS